MSSTLTNPGPKPEHDLKDEVLEGSPPFDLLRLPLLGRFLSWRHSRTLIQIPVLLVSIAMILHGLFGPQLAPKNLATVLSWVHFRGALVLVLLCAGNFFCLACPFMLVRNAMRRFVRPRFNWPRRLRNKWIPAALFVLILFTYELFSMWSSPWITAWIIVGYFAAVLLIDGLFKHAAFCKFVCPIGQFNFIAATVSPTEVAVRDHEICDGCRTRDCIRGRREPAPNPAAIPVILQRGCELALFQPAKSGNMDCTFCLDCVHACPHDNVGILSRLPASELLTDPPRSGIGLFSRRKDIAALTIVFCFGAIMNAFGMVSPVYAVETWLSRILHLRAEAPTLGLIFAAVILLEPAILLGFAAWITRTWGKVRQPWLQILVRYTYSLVPIGFGMWLAHYGYHFFTGLYTIVPVTQSALADLGWPIFGNAQWTLVGLPQSFVQPIEFGFLLLGLAGSLMIVWRLAEQDAEDHAFRAFTPWATICLMLWIASLWLMTQPMDMRATIMAG
jgi:hypothetical protein